MPSFPLFGAGGPIPTRLIKRMILFLKFLSFFSPTGLDAVNPRPDIFLLSSSALVDGVFNSLAFTFS